MPVIEAADEYKLKQYFRSNVKCQLDILPKIEEDGSDGVSDILISFTNKTIGCIQIQRSDFERIEKRRIKYSDKATPKTSIQVHKAHGIEGKPKWK